MGCSSAAPGSGARLALRLERQTLEAKAKAKAKAKANAKARAKAEARSIQDQSTAGDAAGEGTDTHVWQQQRKQAVQTPHSRTPPEGGVPEARQPDPQSRAVSIAVRSVAKGFRRRIFHGSFGQLPLRNG